VAAEGDCRTLALLVSPFADRQPQYHARDQSIYLPATSAVFLELFLGIAEGTRFIVELPRRSDAV
jgi:hypothetical protein